MNFDPLLLFTSFVAGLLTIVAPCVLPLLPVIVGGAAASRNRWYPFILTGSLTISVILFTLILKASTLLIDIPEAFWKSLSGGILMIFGVFWLFPRLWEQISVRLNLIGKSQENLAAAGRLDSGWGGVVMGAALGPVFSSCSPTYFVILATVLPVSFFAGIIYLLVYGAGLALMLGLIAFFGQRLTKRLGWAANPEGLFRKSIGALLILVGLSIITGYEKKIETAILDAGFGVTQLEERLLENMDEMEPLNEAVDSGDKSGLPILFEAPFLVGLQNWINHAPINSLAELKGKVVLIDFWTYSCINCIRTLPYLQSWHEKYADDGLVILGIHAPEFQFEQKFENVQKAVNDFGLTYAVVQDNDFRTWRAYQNRFWPAKYLIDRNGFVRYTHFGEGEYDETEGYIAALLDTTMEEAEVVAQAVDFRKIGTRETYLGLRRRENYVPPTVEFLRNGEWTLTGEWAADDEKAVSQSSGAGIKMRFTAAKANLVIGGSGKASVTVDGQPSTAADVQDGELVLNGERLYELANFGMEYGEHEIEIIFEEPGVELFAWTFG